MEQVQQMYMIINSDSYYPLYSRVTWVSMYMYIHTHVYIIEPLYCGHHWDRPKCLLITERCLHISFSDLYTKATSGTSESVY